MMTGKARIVRTREVAQSEVDEFLIDQYLDGDPPDEFESREVRIVYGSKKLSRSPDDSGAFTAEEVFSTGNAGAYQNAESYRHDREAFGSPFSVLLEGIEGIEISETPPDPRLPVVIPHVPPALKNSRSAAIIRPRLVEYRAPAEPSATPAAGKAAPSVSDRIRWTRFAVGLGFGAAAGIALLTALKLF